MDQLSMSDKCTEELIQLLSGVDHRFNSKNNFTIAPLHLAVIHGRKDAVNMLLSMGAKVNETGKTGYTSLHIASFMGYHEFLELLVDNNGDVYSLNSDNESLLHCAAYGFISNSIDCWKVIEYLVNLYKVDDRLKFALTVNNQGHEPADILAECHWNHAEKFEDLLESSGLKFGVTNHIQ